MDNAISLQSLPTPLWKASHTLPTGGALAAPVSAAGLASPVNALASSV